MVEARRLLQDRGRASTMALSLFGQWLGLAKLAALSKDASVISSFGEDLKRAMREETERFLTRAVLEDGRWTSVLQGRDSFLNEPLARLYGLPGITGAAFVARALPPERAGLFTLSAFLALKALPQESSPVHRGKVVAERLLCIHLAPPPPDLVVDPPPVAPGVQTREAYAKLTSPPACAGCHAVLNPLGFAFEGFDAVGRHRTTEAGRPVDTTGSIVLDGNRVAFGGALDLLAAIGTSVEARSCLVDQWMMFALGRPLEPGDEPSRAAVRAAFERRGHELHELVVALVTSDSFRLRVPAEEEVTP
jgi:hypothetical protein